MKTIAADDDSMEEQSSIQQNQDYSSWESSQLANGFTCWVAPPRAASLTRWDPPTLPSNSNTCLNDDAADDSDPTSPRSEAEPSSETHTQADLKEWIF